MFTLVAKGSLALRPMTMLEAPLDALGARCQTSGGQAPIEVRGPIHGGALELDGSLTSQFVSGLLIALPTCRENSTIDVNNLASKPYVALTLDLIERFGIHIDHSLDFARFSIKGGQVYQPICLTIDGDWSATAFLLVAGAVAGKVIVSGLDHGSVQPDRAVLEVLRLAGAEIEVGASRVRVSKQELKAFTFDATDCPDLFPPLVALASACSGESVLTGVSRLAHKESNRAESLKTEYAKLGVSIHLHGNEMRISGGDVVGGNGDSHGDHRVAMSLAIAGLVSKTGVGITEWECVSKSYPRFFDDLAAIREENL
jgi:3-phosphoshikimate 1-carboxyvinyltransferase